MKFENARQKLRDASTFLNDLERSLKVRDGNQSRYLSGFLSCARSVSFVLQKEIAGDPSLLDRYHNYFKCSPSVAWNFFVGLRNEDQKKGSVRPREQVKVLFGSPIGVPPGGSIVLNMDFSTHPRTTVLGQNGEVMDEILSVVEKGQVITSGAFKSSTPAKEFVEKAEEYLTALRDLVDQLSKS